MNTFAKLALMLVLGMGLMPAVATAQSFSPFYPEAPAEGRAFGLATDSEGNLYIASNSTGMVEVVEDDGSHLKTIGSDDDGCSFVSPRGLALDDAGTLYVVDHSGDALIKVSDPTGTPSCTTLDTGPLTDPFDVAVHENTLYISMVGDGSVKAVDLLSPSGATDVITGLNTPTGLAVDASGNLYVATAANNIVKYDGETTDLEFATLINHGADYGPIFLAFGPLIPIDPNADNPFPNSQMLYLTSFKERGFPGYIDYVEANGEVNSVSGPTGNAFTGLAFNALGSMFYVELLGDYSEPAAYRINRSDVAFPSLPVELTSFEAIVDRGQARLVWTTASEINNAGFEVQQRFGNGFEAVGFVPGNGTTIEAQSYGYEVGNLDPGRYVFRLKQVDYDGTFAYSEEVEVSIELAESYHVSAAYPNPFNPQTQFELTLAQDQQVRVAVYDALGRQLALLHDGSLRADQVHRFTFEAANLPSGMYLIQVRGEFFNTSQPITLLK